MEGTTWTRQARSFIRVTSGNMNLRDRLLNMFPGRKVNPGMFTDQEVTDTMGIYTKNSQLPKVIQAKTPFDVLRIKTDTSHIKSEPNYHKRAQAFIKRSRDAGLKVKQIDGVLVNYQDFSKIDKFAPHRYTPMR